MCDANKLPTSDDEEDLEALRLAALQSLKKKNAALNGINQTHHSPHSGLEKRIRYSRSMKGNQNKRGRFFGPHQGRNGKNAQFNNRARNTNLISIPTIPSEDDKVIEKKSDVNGTTFNLPQDRYCGKEQKTDKSGEGTSKFTRYDKSDKSESESEEEEAVSSEDDSPGKLKKSNSLEALMEELDAEIQGKTITKEEKPAKEDKPKKKIKKKKRTTSEAVSTSDSDVKVGEQKEEKVDCDKNVEIVKHNSEKSTSETDNKDQKVEEKVKEEQVEIKNKLDDSCSPATKRLRSRSPQNRRGFHNRRRRGNFHKFSGQPIPNIPFAPPPAQYPAPILPFPNQPFNPIFCPTVINQPPPFFERPLSPLAINTESLTTATLAPLSPRSAAFVLENKAIIERRKRSPRRSYSRSPSRSPRRSLTPRRSPRRSLTPRRISRSPRRLSRSPRRRSPSPRRRSLSPRRRNVGRTTDNSPKTKPPVRDRLGIKLNKTEESKEKPKEPSPKKEEKPLDPVLEARKRKFESNEIKMREGIIRLKPKEEKPKENPVLPPVAASAPVAPPVTTLEQAPAPVEEKQQPKEPDEYEELEKLLKEDALLEGDDIDLDPKVDDIFSDEDSASDNEGRFKVKQQTGKKPPVLSFTKLVNGAKRDIKSEALPDSQDKRRERRTDRYDKKRSRPRTPVDRKDVKENVKEEENKNSKKAESQEKVPAKSRISLKSERHVTPIEKRFERKIEIKIKNPSKYERGGKLKFSKDGEEKTPEKVKRKVELGNKEMEEGEDAEHETVVENNSGDEENSVISEGDLRAQLSKKRAEKLHRIPIEGVSSRLLQSALQGAVFKETKKKTKDQDISSSEFAAIKRIVHADYFSRRFCLAVKTQRTVRVYKHKHFKFRYSSAPTDGKLPIHLRLGIANNSDIFTDTKVKRKSRKRKNREVLEQV